MNTEKIEFNHLYLICTVALGLLSIFTYARINRYESTDNVAAVIDNWRGRAYCPQYDNYF